MTRPVFGFLAACLTLAGLISFIPLILGSPEPALARKLVVAALTVLLGLASLVAWVILALREALG